MRASVIAVLFFCGVLRAPTDSKSIADPYTYVLHGDSIHWPSKSVRKIYSTSGRYKASNIIPTRFQSRGLYAVLAFPRLRPGVPITLGKIPLLANRRVPEVKAFPSWDMQEEGNHDAIQNAVDLFLDEKAVLWVLDTGWVNTLSAPKMTGHPRVLGINFYTGKIVYDVDLTRFAKPNSNFQYVVAENSMGRPFIFVSCAADCSVIVWDVLKEKGGVVSLPDPSKKGDILYMVLLRPRKSEPLVVFSHLSYPALCGVPVSSLRKGRLGKVKNLGEKTGEMVVLGTDNGSKIFFRWKGDHQVRIWDLGTREGERGAVVGADDEHRTSTQVAGGSRLLTWSLETNFPDFVKGGTVSGDEACEMGLVGRVVSGRNGPNAAYRKAMQLAIEISRNKAAAVQCAKKALNIYIDEFEMGLYQEHDLALNLSGKKKY